MKIEVIGTFKSIKNDEIADLIEESAKVFDIPQNNIVEVVSATDAEIKELNVTYRNKDEVTDVLSFPIGNTEADINILGTIVIAEEYSLKNNESLEELVKHGILHLIGYDHEENLTEWKVAAKKINHRMG